MTVTSKQVAGKLAAYLHHRISLSQLVDWAERAMMEGDFQARNLDRIRDVVARLGLADVRAFGLTWENCEQFLDSLGYAVRVEIVEAGPRSTTAVAREKPRRKYSS
ncbi:MAG TPA: hypothetical protein VL486_01640 [Verrucomicrobiae bacterium]|nr:hypothetical protein [Verrucomicrobiae bacterium]